VPITTNVVSSNPADGEVYSILQYVIKFFSDLGQVGGFLRFPPQVFYEQIMKDTTLLIDIALIIDS
jgi:hypothetical protein